MPLGLLKVFRSKCLSFLPFPLLIQILCVLYLEMNPQASSKHHGLSRGGIAGVVVGSTLFVVLIFIVVHLLLKLRTCRRSQTKKSTYLSVHTRDPRFGGHYHAYAESTVEHSYEDPDDLSNKQLGSNSTASSYRERFQNRMV